jgi:hypothetical protein
VVTVSVAIPPPGLFTLTGFVDPKLKVGRSIAFAGLDVMAAVSVTEPVKPPEGTTAMLEVFPALAPAATVTAVPLTV